MDPVTTPVDDLDRLIDVYRAMATNWLEELRRGFLDDRAMTASPATQAFCTERLTAIDAVLQERIV